MKDKDTHLVVNPKTLMVEERKRQPDARLRNPNGGPPQTLWRKGTAPYHDWLKTLTPEQLAEHEAMKQKKKSLKALMDSTINDSKEFWQQAMMLALGAQLHKAVETGDTQAFTALWDRTIGKPETVMTVGTTVDENLDDIMTKLQASTVNNIIEDNDGNKE